MNDCTLTHTDTQVNYLSCFRNSKQIKYDELIKTTKRTQTKSCMMKKKVSKELRSDALRKLKDGSEGNADREVEL